MKINIKEKTKEFNSKLKNNFSKKKENFNKVKQDLEKKIKNLFEWIKGAELVSLEKCDTNDDPVRPELDNYFITS